MFVSAPKRKWPALAGSDSLSSPTGGWNARDSLADMDALDAVYLTNMYPSTTDVSIRNGYTKWSTGYPGEVETIMSYAGGSSNKLFGVSDGNIYNATTGGAIGAAEFSGLSNSRLQYINVATAGGQFIRSVNGADKSLLYDGTTWAQDGSGAPADITGVDSATLSNLTLFKTRIWFTQNSTLSAWYLDSGAIGGAATEFPLQGIAKLGGYLVSVATWTLDAGEGIDDYLVFITNKGEVIVYQGIDPSDIATFSLKGVWALGAPVGKRCMNRLAGDLLLLGQDGLVPFSGALQSSRVNPRVALTDKIQQAISEATNNYGTNFGWQTLYYPKNNLLFVNIPIGIGQQQQYVMNTITKSWCNFTGWYASCWEIYQDDPYFGSTGYIAKAWDTLSDNGANINYNCKQAFNYFKTPGLLKRWMMMRPIIRSNGSPAFLAGINVDFEDQDITGLPNFTPVSYGIWDTSLWDFAIWGGGLTVIKNWQGVTGVGYCAAIKLQGASSGIDVRWMSTDLTMERGAIL